MPLEPVIAGHPLHPSIITLPVGLFSASYILDLLTIVTDDDRLADAAYYNMLIGAAGAIPAAATGFLDYLQMKQNDPAKKTATTHGLMNAGAIVLYSLNLLLRTGNRRSKLGFLISTVGTAGLMVSAYLGGEIAYGRGWRVRNAERFELEWQKEHGVGPFAPEGAPARTTEQEYPPETIKGFREKRSGEAVFKELKGEASASHVPADAQTAHQNLGADNFNSLDAASQSYAPSSKPQVTTNQELSSPGQSDGQRSAIDVSLGDVSGIDHRPQALG